MGSISNQLELDLLEHVVKRTQFTIPPAIYCRLSTTTIAENGTGISEPSGFGYAPVLTTGASNVWGRSGRVVSNSVGAIDFGTATGSWGTITDWYLSRVNTGDGGGTDMLAYGQFPASYPVGNTDQFKIQTGDASITANTGGFSNFYAGKMLDSVFLLVGLYTPSVVWAALGSAAIEDGDTGSLGSWELPNSNGYARVQCNHGVISWNAASAGAITNADTINFPTVVTSDWPTIVSGCLTQSGAYGGGEILRYGSIASIIASVGETPRFSPGTLQITLD